MARYNYRPGDRELEARVTVPDILVAIVDDAGIHRVSERVEPIEASRRSRFGGPNTSWVEPSQRTLAVIPSIKRIG